MAFHVGQKVVCVNDRFGPRCPRTLPPLAVLDALRRPRPKPYLLTPSEIHSRRRKAKETSAYTRKAFAHLRPAEVPSGDHMPPPHVLLALFILQVPPRLARHHEVPLLPSRHARSRQAGRGGTGQG